MKVSLNWVKQFTDIDVSTDELVKLATERLGGVEGVIDLSRHYEGIIVAKVVNCQKHPNADKLSLCKVDDGGVVKNVARDENGYVQVVCGAPNIKEGLLVAWIPPQSVVPVSYGEKELFVLEARDLRGELSNGMLASPRELGLNEDHEGILEIDPNEQCHSELVSESTANQNQTLKQVQGDGTVKPGTPFKNLYDLDDVILEIENKMFTHRPDGFGQLGVARELAGIQHKAFKSPDWYVEKIVDRRSKIEESSVSSPQSPVLSVTVEADDLCPRYMGVVLENVQIKPSPIWLQSYLKRVGVRPINNVVDITNYMMILTAQPLHAFDFDKVSRDGTAEIIVRRPKQGEKMTLLDGKEIEPHKDAVLICNSESPIALGGVMGGGNSEVDEKTTRVVLECATFDMYNIRKTSMIHGIFTDAVTRFNKGQPAAQLPPVLYKAVQMFEELAGANMVGDVVDASTKHEARSTKHEYIEITSKFINERLGSKFSDQEIVTLLGNVEFEAHVASGPISVTPPFWRTDIEIPEDIVEEVGRLYGFNRLPIALPERSIAPVTPEPMRALKSELRSVLSRAGAHELLTYSFVHGNLLQKAGQDSKQAYALRNALSPDLQYYRLSLMPSLLDRIYPNIKAGFDEFALFELGKTHDKRELDKDDLPREFHRLAFVYAHKKESKNSAYFIAKRYAELIFKRLQLTEQVKLVSLSQYNFKDHVATKESAAPFNPERSAVVFYGDRIAGVVGEFTESVKKAFKLPNGSAGFELSLSALLEKGHTGVLYTPLSKFPSSEQDLTLKVAADVAYEMLERCLKQELEKSEYDWQLQPVSIYQKETETKNVTFKITLTHHERTLTNSEVTALVEKLSWVAHEELSAEQA